MAEASEAVGPRELSEGWAWARLETVLALQYGKALAASDRDRSGSYPVFGSSGVVGRHSAAIAPGNAIIVGRKGSAGSVYYSSEPCWPIDTAYFTSGSAAVNIRYAFWFLSFRKLNRLDQSTAIPSLSRDRYNEQFIPLAPFPEQRRIVERIDALFAEIAEGEAALAEARKGLDLFRRALLKAAVTGELTRDWRAANKSAETGAELLKSVRSQNRGVLETNRQRGHAGSRSSFTVEASGGLPATWDEPRLADLAWASSYGTSVKCTPRTTGVPVLRIPNIRKGLVDLANLKFASQDLGLESADFVKPGDLLIIRTNGSEDLIGRAAILIEPLAEAAYFASYLIRFRIVGDVRIWKWVSMFFESPIVRRWMASKIASSAGQYNVSQSALAELSVPLPPSDELDEILRQVSEALAAADDAEKQLDDEAADAARLKQAILKSAFEGCLVPQDPADEPASALLTRLVSPSEGPRGRGRRRPVPAPLVGAG